VNTSPVISREKSWAANANGRYGWCIKITYANGLIEWEHSR
jgi:hypothetical protein